jgi:hypothetical protein
MPILNQIVVTFVVERLGIMMVLLAVQALAGFVLTPKLIALVVVIAIRQMVVFPTMLIAFITIIATDRLAKNL